MSSVSTSRDDSHELDVLSTPSGHTTIVAAPLPPGAGQDVSLAGDSLTFRRPSGLLPADAPYYEDSYTSTLPLDEEGDIDFADVLQFDLPAAAPGLHNDTPWPLRLSVHSGDWLVTPEVLGRPVGGMFLDLEDVIPEPRIHLPSRSILVLPSTHVLHSCRITLSPLYLISAPTT